MTALPGDAVPVPEYPSPTIVDSRRLMGPNLLHPGLGAILDVRLDDAHPARNATLLSAWHARATALAAALGWAPADTVERRYPGGASLFLHAPIDQLMTATDVCEAAWVLAEHDTDGLTNDVGVVVERLRDLARQAARPALVALWDEAQRHGVNCTVGDDRVAVGTGIGAQAWPVDHLPAADAIDWSAIRDIPIALVTGSNGKTTVTRMVAAMARAEGHVVGYTCTDGVWIDGQQVEAGDWSGPLGARRVLQDQRVTLAVLESARGGMLRRGLALQRATVAAIITLSPDHLGDYGIHDLATLAEAKLIVGRAVQETGVLWYNAAVPALRRAVANHPGRVLPVDPGAATAALGLTAHELATIPATLAGSATHNLLNARVAAAIAESLGFGDAARQALLRFGGDPGDNIGRLQLQRIGAVTVVVDYAHNAQGVAALIEATRHLPAVRRAITLGTGGDRDDTALQEMAHAAFESGLIDCYIAKEMPRFLRGRAPGSTSAVLLDALRACGVAESQLVSAPDDLSAAASALAWARDGDLVLLATHDQRDAVLALLADRARKAAQ